MRTKYPRHLPGFSYVGRHQYSLTFCTADRHPAFASADGVEDAWSQILRAGREQGVEVIAYCFMPDHVHLVVQGAREDSDLKVFIRLAKQYSGYHYSRRRSRRLWQRYSYEHVIRDDERLDRVVRYILDNPIRAGLVTSVQDYPYIGSSVYTRRELLEFACRHTPRSRAPYRP
jgi:putative transposase